MLIFLLALTTQFSIRYENFLASPRSDSIFVTLTRNNDRLNDYRQDPVVLWFWRTQTADPRADSMLKAIAMRPNLYLASVLRWEAKETDDYETALAKLNLAAHFDSTALENWFSYMSLAVSQRKFELLPIVLSLPFFNDFRNQIFFFTNLWLLLITTIVISSAVYVIIKTIYYLPLLSHRLDPLSHIPIKGILTLVILLAPVLILRHFYLAIIFYGLILTLTLEPAERNWLRAMLFIVVVMIVLPLPIAQRITFLKQHNKAYQLYEMVNYDTNDSLTAETVKEQELLAYALKQRGEFAAAFALYDDLYKGGNPNAKVINNLANLYFLDNRVALAETLYKKALLVQDRGEPYFNLGLLKLKNIEYLESSRYMEEAKKRNFSSLLNEPADISPTNDDLYQIMVAAKLPVSRLVRLIYLIPLVAIFLLTFSPFRFSPPFYCAACGRPICEKCSNKAEADIICQDCFTKFKSTKTGELEDTLRLATSQRRKTTNTLITYFINIICPGAGLVFQGKNLFGMIIVFFTVLAYTPILFSKLLVLPDDWVSLSTKPISILAAVIILVPCYIFSFGQIRRK